MTAYVLAAGFDPTSIVECVQFAHDPKVQDELARLVAAGIKRATTALYSWYVSGAERLPKIGDLFVVVDSKGHPHGICRMSAVEIRRFKDVDAAFARDEGEADLSLASWRGIHERFFGEEARVGGFFFDEKSLVVLQSFDLVAP